MNNTLLSVILPMYNGADYITECLSSVLNQIDDRVEILVLDDGSTDSSLDLIKKLNSKQIILFTNLNFRNWVKSTNHGIINSRGQYLTILHQDDRWEDCRYNEFLNIINLRSDYSFIFNPSYFISNKSKIIGTWSSPLSIKKNSHAPVQWNGIINLLTIQNFIACPSPIFKRELAEEVGPMDEALWYTADWDYWLRLMEKGKTIYLNKYLTSFRISKNSQTINKSRELGTEDFLNQLETVQNKYFKNSAWASLVDSKTIELAKTSNYINLLLMTRYNKIHLPFSFYLKTLKKLPLFSLLKLIKISRLHERILSRLRTL